MTMNTIRTAMGIFGFDLTIEKPWDPFREAIGSDRFDRAIDIGRGSSDRGRRI